MEKSFNLMMFRLHQSSRSRLAAGDDEGRAEQRAAEGAAVCTRP